MSDLFFIGGPCVIESEAHALRHAKSIAEIARAAGVDYIYKSSYDKANRTSGKTYRGPGLKDGLAILAKVKKQTGLRVLTDVHSPEEAKAAAKVVDVLQIPAMLCRQTDLVVAAAKTKRGVNIKNFRFGEAFEKSIEAKVVAEQNALTERNNRDAAKFRADQVIETARGQAETFKLQNQQLTAQNLQLEWIKKWDGKLPTYIMGSDAKVLLNLPSK